MPSSRELTRLQAVLVAPVFSNYTELLNGLTIIRAFKKQKELSSKMYVLSLASNPHQHLTSIFSTRFDRGPPL